VGSPRNPFETNASGPLQEIPMENRLSQTPLSPASGRVFQRHAAVVPALSVDSLRGALLWLGLTLLTAVLGGLASANAADFYGSLRLPAWAPPGWVFGPVWSLLYALMALAAWLVWRHRHTVRGASGLLLYSLALLPNALWSWLFFDWHLGLWALVDIGALWLLVGLTVRAFWRVQPTFGLMMLPLWLWVSFAGLLNAVLWRTNPALLG
jgi:tryptophan-rich sensory protein